MGRPDYTPPTAAAIGSENPRFVTGPQAIVAAVLVVGDMEPVGVVERAAGGHLDRVDVQPLVVVQGPALADARGLLPYRQLDVVGLQDDAAVRVGVVPAEQAKTKGKATIPASQRFTPSSVETQVRALHLCRLRSD